MRIRETSRMHFPPRETFAEPMSPGRQTNKQTMQGPTHKKCFIGTLVVKNATG